MENMDWKLNNVSPPDISEEVKIHQIKGYQKEKITLDLIQAGRVDELQSWLDIQDGIKTHGMLHNGEFAHDYTEINVALQSTIVLASRAAIVGGVELGEAFYIMNRYRATMSKLKNDEDIYQNLHKCFIEFATAVRDCKRTENTEGEADYLSKRIDNYIRSHVCNPITVKMIAEYLNMNYSYLSHTYQERNGITITKRIQQIKCGTAKRLLLTTDMTLNELSCYLGFSSQSHFQNLFKKICSETPNVYRKRNRM